MEEQQNQNFIHLQQNHLTNIINQHSSQETLENPTQKIFNLNKSQFQIIEEQNTRDFIEQIKNQNPFRMIKYDSSQDQQNSFNNMYDNSYKIVLKSQNSETISNEDFSQFQNNNPRNYNQSEFISFQQKDNYSKISNQLKPNSDQISNFNSYNSQEQNQKKQRDQRIKENKASLQFEGNHYQNQKQHTIFNLNNYSYKGPQIDTNMLQPIENSPFPNFSPKFGGEIQEIQTQNQEQKFPEKKAPTPPSAPRSNKTFQFPNKRQKAFANERNEKRVQSQQQEKTNLLMSESGGCSFDLTPQKLNEDVQFQFETSLSSIDLQNAQFYGQQEDVSDIEFLDVTNEGNLTKSLIEAQVFMPRFNVNSQPGQKLLCLQTSQNSSRSSQIQAHQKIQEKKAAQTNQKHVQNDLKRWKYLIDPNFSGYSNSKSQKDQSVEVSLNSLNVALAQNQKSNQNDNSFSELMPSFDEGLHHQFGGPKQDEFCASKNILRDIKTNSFKSQENKDSEILTEQITTEEQ